MMKLVIAIIQNKFTNGVIKGLMEKNIRATKLASTGGFLNSGNTTFLIGIEDENVDELKELIRSKVKVEEVKSESGSVTVSGAHLFVVDVDKAVFY